MTLHLILDYEKEFNFPQGDVVFLTTRNRIILPPTVSVIYNDNVLGNDSVENQKYVKQFYDMLPEKYRPTANMAFSPLFLPVYNYLSNINDVLQSKPIDRIVLYDGSYYAYVSATGAEGETNRGKYLSNWLVNAIVYKKYKGRLTIEWKDRKSSLHMRTLNAFFSVTRNVKVLIFELAKSIMDVFQRRENKLCPENVFSIIELKLQYRHLNKLCKALNTDCWFYSINKHLCRETDKIHYIPALPIYKMTSLWLTSVFSPSHMVEFYGCRGRRIKKEIDYLLFQYQLKELRLKRYFGEFEMNGKKLITDMTVGCDIISCHSLVSLGINHQNYQYVSMGRVLYPNVDLADEYYLYSKKTFEFYKRMSSIYKYYFPISNNNREANRGGLLRLTFFLQPDGFVYDYLSLMKTCFHLIENFPIEVCVKPHYRQNEMEEIKNVCAFYPFVQIAKPDDSVEEILNRTDIALSIHSSVLFEALSNQVMCVVYNPGGKYDKDVYDQGICFPEVSYVITEPEALIPYIKNYVSYNELFRLRLKSFVDTRGTGND